MIRVVVCSYPGIFADTVIKVLQQNQAIEVVGLVHSQRVFSANENWIAAALRMINTSGIDYALLQFLQTDVYLLLKKLFSSKKSHAEIPIYATKQINSQAGVTFLKNLQPDVILLANFNQKVSPALIGIPALACLNIHPSLLPDFKGVDPVFAALYANQTRLGVSVHRVDENFDTGEILAQTQLVSDKQASVFYHHWQLFRQGAQLAVNVIQQLPQNVVGKAQNGAGNYDSWPTKAKVKAFKQRGGHLIHYQEYMNAVKTLLG
jgi:methionyl-tRNA formyltransferase